MIAQFNENKKAAYKYLTEVAKDSSFTDTHMGYTIAPHKIHRCFGLTPEERMILIDLFGFMGDNHMCFPSQETIARNIGCSSKTVGRRITALVSKKLILVSSRQKNHRYYLPKDLDTNPYILMSEKTHEFIREVRETVNDSKLTLWIDDIIKSEAYKRYLEKIKDICISNTRRLPYMVDEPIKRCLEEYNEYLINQYNKCFKVT